MVNDQSSRVRTGYGLVFAAATFVFLYLRTFVLPGTPLVAYGDETIFFGHGIRILHGQVPFRDYFTFVMPGTDLFYAGAFGVLGVHAWVAQGFVIVLGGAIAGALVWMSRKVLNGVAIFLPALLFLTLDFDVNKDATHHWYSTLLVLAASGVLLGGGVCGGSWWRVCCVVWRRCLRRVRGCWGWLLSRYIFGGRVKDGSA